MENLYLGYETAQWYWEHVKYGARKLAAQATCKQLHDCAKTPASVAKIVRGTLFENLPSKGLPLHVMVNGPFSRNAASIHFHTHANTFPEGSFVRLSRSIYLASPQLSLVQAAQRKSFGRAFLYGSALCGQFALDESQEHGLRSRPQLVDAEQIGRFIELCGAVDGCQKSKTIARYLTDGSASPRESMLLAALTLPKRYGGWGLSGAKMNQRIDIPQRFCWPGQRKFFVADLYWPEAKVAVEYDSDIEHAHKLGIYRDSLKRNTLLDMGYTTLCVTSVQLNSPAELAHVADTLRRCLGRRKTSLPANFDALQAQLRRELGLCGFDDSSEFDGGV